MRQFFIRILARFKQVDYSWIFPVFDYLSQGHYYLMKSLLIQTHLGGLNSQRILAKAIFALMPEKFLVSNVIPILFENWLCSTNRLMNDLAFVIFSEQVSFFLNIEHVKKGKKLSLFFFKILNGNDLGPELPANIFAFAWRTLAVCTDSARFFFNLAPFVYGLCISILEKLAPIAKNLVAFDKYTLLHYSYVWILNQQPYLEVCIFFLFFIFLFLYNIIFFLACDTSWQIVVVHRL